MFQAASSNNLKGSWSYGCQKPEQSQLGAVRNLDKFLNINGCKSTLVYTLQNLMDAKKQNKGLSMFKSLLNLYQRILTLSMCS